MTSSAEPNFESVALGKQIIDLDAEVWREVKAGRYQHAAELRDQRELFQRKLSALGNPTVIRNVNAALDRFRPRAPLLTLLEEAESAVDPELWRLIGDAPLPPRWLVHGIDSPCQATIAKRLNTESLDSTYFRARLPVFSSATFGRATIPAEWLNAAIRETARATGAVVWIVQEPIYFAELGLLDGVVCFLREPYTKFVVCLPTGDDALASRFAEIPNVSMMMA